MPNLQSSDSGTEGAREATGPQYLADQLTRPRLTLF